MIGETLSSICDIIYGICNKHGSVSPSAPHPLRGIFKTDTLCLIVEKIRGREGWELISGNKSPIFDNDDPNDLKIGENP